MQSRNISRKDAGTVPPFFRSRYRWPKMMIIVSLAFIVLLVLLVPTVTAHTAEQMGIAPDQYD